MSDISELLKTIPYGLALLTVRRGDEINGMPVSWYGQVSSDPPLIQVAVKPERYSHDMMRDAGKFALVFLSKDQKALVLKFKAKGAEKATKFDGLKISDTSSGFPTLDDAIGWMDCRVVATTKPGDHTLFVAEITAAKVTHKGEALTLAHYGKDYHYGIK